MPFDVAAKNAMLNDEGGRITAVSLHSGDPGAGATNEVSGSGYVRQAPTWAPASAGEKALSADLSFTGPANQAVSWFALWDAGGVRRGKGQITTGDTAFNAAGEYKLTTGTKLRLTDPV